MIPPLDNEVPPPLRPRPTPRPPLRTPEGAHLGRERMRPPRTGESHAAVRPVIARPPIPRRQEGIASLPEDGVPGPATRVSVRVVVAGLVPTRPRRGRPLEPARLVIMLGGRPDTVCEVVDVVR